MKILFFILIFHLNRCLKAQFRAKSIDYSTPFNCTNQEFYNRFSLRCENCPNSTIPSSDRLECKCPPGERQILTQFYISICEKCPQGTFASPDQTDCLRCEKNRTCECSNRSVLIYRDSAGALLDEARCATCATGFYRDTDRGATCQRCVDSCSCQNCSSIEHMYTRIRIQNGNEMRSSFIENVLPIAVQQCAQRNVQYCETLVNLCVLQNYESSMINSCGLLDGIKRSFNPWQNSWDPLAFADDSELEKDNVIDHQYRFEPTSSLQLIFARYDVNGTFDGYFDADKVHLHFCGNDLEPKSSFLFGRRYHRECVINKNVFSNPNPGRKLFEMFLKFVDSTGKIKIYPLHVVNSAIRSNDQIVNLIEKNSNRWILTRRFFLFDDYSINFENSTTLRRFAAKIGLHVNLQKSRDGYIMPPYLSIEYDDSINSILTSSLSIFYHKDPSDYDQKIVIFLSILIPLSLFCAALCSYSWGRRMGKPSAVDASSILYFFVSEISILGDVFFILFGIIACWVTFAYKSQSFVYYNMLSNEQELSLFRYIIAALVLKFAGLIFTMAMLVFQETFFIDWERQKLKQVDDQSGNLLTKDLTNSLTEAEPIVVWRTYLIANEWNELQQYRKTSLALQLILLIFVNEYFEIKKWALVEPGFDRYNPSSSDTETTILSRLALIIFTYILILLIQWLIQVILIERLIVDPFHNFIDLCSVSNISVLSLTHSLYGFYIHGRSVHGKGDAGMSEMNAFLQRERDNLCGFRGLEPSSELQTFIVNLPSSFRQRYDEISSLARNSSMGTVGHDAFTSKMNATVEAHSKMNNFLKNLIDHSIPNIDYIVRDRPILESILDVEMSDSSITGTFTRDPSEICYSQCFVYGNEWAWCSFECLTVCVFYIWSGSLHLACFVIFVISNLIRLLFGYLSTNHLVKTSFIDQRFLV